LKALEAHFIASNAMTVSLAQRGQVIPGLFVSRITCLDCQGKFLVSAGYDTTVRVWNVGDWLLLGPTADDVPASVES